MRIRESRHAGELWLMYWLGNLTAIDSDWVGSIGIAWLFKEDDKWCFMPRITGNGSLFYNAVFFVRYTNTILSVIVPVLMYALGAKWPMFLLLGRFFWSVRWSDSSTVKSIWQAGCGFKLNGRFAPLSRFQSDASSAAGVTGPNSGQATGFNYGTH